MEKKYIFRDYTYSQLKNNINMPSFQRRMVWNLKQKKNLLKVF